MGQELGAVDGVHARSSMVSMTYPEAVSVDMLHRADGHARAPFPTQSADLPRTFSALLFLYPTPSRAPLVKMYRHRRAR